MTIISKNPATEEVMKKFVPLSAQAVDKKLTQSKNAFGKWKETPVSARRALMEKVAEILKSRSKIYGELITKEMGRPIAKAVSEVEKCAWVVAYYAEHAEQLLRVEVIATEAKKSYVRFDPLGAVLAVMPWNFPFWQVFRFAAPALMAGNVGLLKHASNVPQCAFAIEKIFKDAGFSTGVFTTLMVENAAIEEIIADDRVAAVTLTGSEGAGSKVAAVAGSHIKKSVLELGGSDPFIVLNDADIPRAAACAVQSRMVNAGQTCIAAKRFIVERGVAKEFTAYCVAEMGKLVVGDPMDPKTQVGPLAREDLVQELERQVHASVAKGAKVLLGGHAIKGSGYFYEPTVLANISKKMLAYHEELFGPVASIIVAKNADNAVRIANDSRFGLGANIWTGDIAKAEKMAAQLEAGAVAINDYVKSDPRLPFGGIKKSGYGRELGSYGIKEFTNIKTVVIN